MDTSLVGRQVGHQPLPDEFASMLVELFLVTSQSLAASAFDRAIVVDGGIEIYSGQTEEK